MYAIEYDTKVRSDMLKLGGSEKVRIKRAVDTKLILNPTLYGKPLQYSLVGLRSFRVGEYRVIFRLEESIIFIVFIGHRKNVYQSTRKRAL